jgi:4-amino-4-deoxy-L-arabinose transferase
MAAFGVDEVAVRLPSIVASTVSVGLTFLIGRTLFTPLVGLIAAIFQAFNGFLVDLAAGRRASDHVDTLLLFTVSAGVLAALATSRRSEKLTAVSLGVATGIAYMTKAFSGLILLPMWAIYRLMSRKFGAGAREVTGAAVLAALIVLPWTIYTDRMFPAESSFERGYVFRHLSEAVEGQGGPPWQYFWEMPRMYGELIYIPIAWGLATWLAHRASVARRVLLLWFLLPYALYSSFVTKMPAYVIAAAPPLFILQGEFWLWLKERFDGAASRFSKLGGAIALVVFAVLPARYLLEPHGPLEYRDRDPQWVQDLRGLNEQIGSLKAVIFNVASPVEAMFYTPYVAYEHLPTTNQVQELKARGYAVFLFYDGSGTLPETLPRDVTVIRPAR